MRVLSVPKVNGWRLSLLNTLKKLPRSSRLAPSPRTLKLGNPNLADTGVDVEIAGAAERVAAGEARVANIKVRSLKRSVSRLQLKIVPSGKLLGVMKSELEVPILGCDMSFDGRVGLMVLASTTGRIKLAGYRSPGESGMPCHDAIELPSAK